MGSTPAQAPSRFSVQLLGWLAVFGSAFCFYLATAIIRWSGAVAQIDSAYFVFGRFLLGFIIVCLTMLITAQPLRPRNYHYLIGRTVANTVAVFCFYKAVEVGSLAEANILHLTYPLFVALISWFTFKEQRDRAALLIVLVASCGIWLILSPGSMSGTWDNLWGLVSGFFAAGAMIYLNLSRRFHDSHTILFFMFGLGALGIFLFFRESIFWPNPAEFTYLFWCSVVGVVGQYLLTYGFLFVTAVEGSIISSSRILLAALFGPLLVGDPPLLISGWVGAVLIFAANSALAARRARLNSSRAPYRFK